MNPALLRLEHLRGWQAMTTDQVPVPVTDLLLDDTDWRIDYFEVEFPDADRYGTRRCLIDEDFIVGADAGTERLDRALDAATLRVAPRRRYPGAGEHVDVRAVERGDPT